MENINNTPPTDQNSVNPLPTGQPTENIKPVLLTPALKYALIGLVGLIILVIVATLFGKKSTSQPVTYPTIAPSLSASASAIVKPVSEFAQTQPFQAFEQNLQQLKAQVDESDLSEPQLEYPLLDMEMNYQQ